MRKRPYLAFLAFNAAFFMLDTVASYFSIYLDQLGFTRTMIGTVTSVSSFAAMLLQPVGGAMADRSAFRRRTLQGHQLRPPGVHPLILAEETVAADVHAVASIANGLGDAADAVGGFQNGDGISLFQQLYGGGETRWAGSDDDDLFRFHIGIIPINKRTVKGRSVSLPFVCFLVELWLFQ